MYFLLSSRKQQAETIFLNTLSVCLSKNKNEHITLIKQCYVDYFIAYVWSEHGAQYDLQRSAHPGVSAILQSRPLQQTDERCSAHLTAGHQHREQDSGSYRHIRRETPAGMDHEEDNASFINHYTDLCCFYATACTEKVQPHHLC